MTRTKLYSELFNRYNRERRQFFLDCREESGRQNLRMLKKITILLVPFILFAFFFTFLCTLSFYLCFLYAIFGSWMDYFVTVLCIVWICCFDSRNFSFLCFETKDSLLCGKYNLYIIYTGDVYNNCMD